MLYFAQIYIYNFFGKNNTNQNIIYVLNFHELKLFLKKLPKRIH